MWLAQHRHGGGLRRSSNVVLLLALLWASSARAVDKYYSAAGGGTACTIGAPCAPSKLRSDVSTCVGTDDFFLNRGDIFNYSTGGGLVAGCSGTSANPVTVQAYGSGALPQIVGKGSDNTQTTFQHGFLLSLRDWWVVSGLHITDHMDGIIVLGSRDIVVTGNTVDTVAAAGIVVQGDNCTVSGGMTRTSGRVVVSNNTIIAPGSDPTPPPSSGEGVYVGCDPGHGNTDTTFDVTVTNNAISDSETEAIECKPNTVNCVAQKNLIVNAGWEGITMGWQATVSGNKAIQNRILGAGIRSNVRSCIQLSATATNIDISYNILKDCGQVGSSHNGIRLLNTGTTGVIHHNTIYNADGSCINETATAITPTDNICWASGSGNEATDPLFVNVAGNDFMPTAAAYLGTGASSTDKGAVQRILRGVSTVENATPGQVNTTWNSLFPLTVCTFSSRTVTVGGVARTSSSCTVTGNATTTLPFSGASVTSGQTVTEAASYGAIQAGGWGPTGAQVHPHKSPAIAAGATVTNKVSSGGTPTFISCVVADNDRDAVTINFNSGGSSPMLPATGATGFSFTRAAANWPITSCDRQGSSDIFYCDNTTDAVAGETIGITYGATSGTPTGTLRDDCNRVENPLTQGGQWTTGILSGDVALLANGTSCGRSTSGTGSAYWNPATFTDTDISAIISDAEGDDFGYIELWVRAQDVGGSGTADGYTCRWTGISSGTGVDTISIREYTNGTAAQLVTTDQEFSNGNGLRCAISGSTIQAWYYNGATWTLAVSTTDTSIAAAGRAGIRLNSNTIFLDDIRIGTLAAGGSGNITNTAGASVANFTSTCTNNVGSAPSAPVLTSCSVSDSSPTQILATINAVVPPMLPTSGITGFTARRAGNNWPVSSVARTSNTQFTLTMSTPALANELLDMSYNQATGNVTNSTPTELATATNFQCTNSVLPSTLVLTQSAVRCHDGAVAIPNAWLKREGQGCRIVYGGTAQLVFQLAITGDTPPPFALDLECQDNGGAAYRLANIFGGHLLRIVATPLFVNATPIPSRILSNPGGGSVFNAGQYIDDSTSSPVQTITVEPADTERVFMVEVSPSATASDSLSCRLVFDDGTPIGGSALNINVSEGLAAGF